MPGLRASEPLTRSVVALDPGPKPDLVGPPLEKDGEHLCGEGGCLTSSQDPADGALELLGWGSADHRYMPEAIELQPERREVALGREEGFLDLIIGSSNSALGGEAGGQLIRLACRWWFGVLLHAGHRLLQVLEAGGGVDDGGLQPAVVRPGARAPAP
jgi:hypothetical protein